MSEANNSEALRFAELCERVRQLESQGADRDAIARKLIPTTFLLSALMVVSAIGFGVAHQTLSNLSTNLSVFLQSLFFTSIITSLGFSLMTMILRNQLASGKAPAGAANMAVSIS